MIKIALKGHETCFNLCFVAFDYDVHMLMDNCNSIYMSFKKVKQERWTSCPLSIFPVRFFPLGKPAVLFSHNVDVCVCVCVCGGGGGGGGPHMGG